MKKGRRQCSKGWSGQTLEWKDNRTEKRTIAQKKNIDGRTIQLPITVWAAAVMPDKVVLGLIIFISVFLFISRAVCVLFVNGRQTNGQSNG